jgi:Protein of unknown function (DUF2511)
MPTSENFISLSLGYLGLFGQALRETGRMKISRETVGVGAVGVAMLLALAGCNGADDGAAISSRDVGPQWPFTVSEVRVVCAPILAIFITADGKAYPLNGQAERHPDLYKKGALSKLNDIWKVDPEISKLSPDIRMSLDAFTQKAIEACTKAGKWDPAKV